MFSKINDSVKSVLQKWIIFSPHLIHCPIANNNIKVKLYDGNRVEKTEIHHKVHIQVSVHEIHIDMLKEYYTGFSMVYDGKLIVCINDSDLQLFLPPQLRNMTHRHKIKFFFINKRQVWIIPIVYQSLA